MSSPLSSTPLGTEMGAMLIEEHQQAICRATGATGEYVGQIQRLRQTLHKDVWVANVTRHGSSTCIDSQPKIVTSRLLNTLRSKTKQFDFRLPASSD